MLTAKENILLPLELAGRKVDEQWFGMLVQRFGLAERLGHRPSQLSGGQIQRVALTRALVTRPAVIFADEPTGNLDSASTEAVLSFLRESVDVLGHTVVMVTHEDDDRILRMHDGRIVADEYIGQKAVQAQ